MAKRKLFLGLVALGTLVASIALAFNVLGISSRAAFAGSAGVNVTDFSVPAGQEPWGTTFDSSGNVWVAIPGCDPTPTCDSGTPPGKIAEYNPSASSWVATYQLPAGFAQPLFLVFDGQGNLWFPMPMANSIGMLNPGSHTFQQWAVPTSGAGPWGVAVDHNGKVWFTEHFTNKIGEFDPSSHVFNEFATPADNSQPYGIVIDHANNVWFTENNSSVALIGEHTAGGVLKEYKIRNNPPSGLTPHLITVDPSGNIWWSEGWVGMIGRLNVSQAQPGTTNGVTEYAYPANCGSCGGTHTSGIGVDSNGLVWFDDSLQSIFGSFPGSGNGSFSIYQTPTHNSHPHDGLNVDGQNRIWFTEEFANKLAVATQTNVPPPTPTIGNTPTNTPTNTPSPTNTVSPTPTPSPGTTLAQDTFQRANQKGWGMASDGLTWGGDATNTGVFSIKNNTGQLNKRGGNTYSAVLGPQIANAQVLFSGSMSSFNNTNMGAVLRWTDGNNWYKAYIDGSHLILQKRVNGSTSTLKSVSFAASAGTSYTLRFSITGTTLAVKVWKTGTSEPANWMATATDSTFASGFCGLRILDQSGTTASITSFQALSQ
ncbi:MAG: virginiamycin B lyase family protein [Ktedonobacteraceae bacterium]